MRLNARNLIGIGVVIAVMVGLIFFGTRSTDAPDVTPEAETVANTGDLFTDVDEAAITRFEVRRLATDEAADGEEVEAIEPPYVVMTKDDESIWTIAEATNSTERDADQMMVTGSVGLVVGLAYTDSFSLEETESTLAAFGLENPQAELVLAGEDVEYRVALGNKNPGGTRYYVQTGEDADTVYLVASDILDNVLNFTDAPPYVPPPTATPTAFPTANPYSEVEQTATAQVELEQTATAQAELFATPTPQEAGPDLPEAESTEEPAEDGE